MIAMRRCYAISIIGMEGKNMNHNKKNILKVTALFVFMFFLGWGAGSLQKQQMKKTVETVSVQNQADNWGLGFGAEETQPTGNVTADELKKYETSILMDEYIKEYRICFGKVKQGFTQVEAPKIFAKVNENVQNNKIFVNRTYVTASYQDTKLGAKDDAHTVVYTKTPAKDK